MRSVDLAAEKKFSTTTIYDLVIIGGGVNGCAIAAEAALKGLSVCLIEKNTLASATSSNSSNLIHGGLRYLEYYDFTLVREALKEQVIWQQRAPHLVRPLAFILPHEKHLRPKWLLRIGLWIYDHLIFNKQLPKTKKVTRKKSNYFNKLKPHLTEGFCYYDCATHGAAITLAEARLATQHGATLLTHTTFQSAKLNNHIWQTQCTDQNDKSFTIQSKALMNVGGPWVDKINQRIEPHDPNVHIQTIKGSHIIVPKLYDGEHAYILQNKDNRIVFALPYTNDTTAIGTTDIVYNDDLDDIKIDDTEKNYLCDLINQYFAKQITPEDIIGDWSGVRALATTQTADASAMTREHQLHLLNFEQAPLLTVLGGKLTNARLIGEEALNKLRPFLPWKNDISSKEVPLPGGELDAKGLQDLEHSLIQKYPFVDASVINRLVEQYGSESKTLLSNIKMTEDLGQYFGHGLYACEVDFLVKHYFAETIDDVLFRATRMKTQFSKDEIEELKTYLLSPLSKTKDFDSPTRGEYGFSRGDE